MSNLVEASRLAKHYGRGENHTTVLKDVSLKISESQVICVMGKSGSGKSTLLNLVGGLDRPDRGEIEVCGERIDRLNERRLSQIRSRYIGFVFQHHQLLIDFDALENVMMPHRILHGNPRRARRRAMYLIEAIGLKHRLHHRVSQLSGGEMQRIAVVRALINEPRIILADEPTGNLDGENAENIMAILRKAVKEKGISIIWVTHSKDLIKSKDRLFFLERGKLYSGRGKIDSRRSAGASTRKPSRKAR